MELHKTVQKGSKDNIKTKQICKNNEFTLQKTSNGLGRAFLITIPDNRLSIVIKVL